MTAKPTHFNSKKLEVEEKGTSKNWLIEQKTRRWGENIVCIYMFK